MNIVFYPGLEKISEHFVKPYYFTHSCRDSNIYDYSLVLEKSAISLNDYIAKSFYLDINEISKLILQLTRAYHILFSKKIVHSDVSPGNILINSQGNFQLCDFENSCIYEKVLTQEEYPFNNPSKYVTGEFLAPELYFWAYKLQELIKYDPFKADIFSLGLCILFANKVSIEGLNVYSERASAVAPRFFTETKEKLRNFHYNFFLKSCEELQEKIDNRIESDLDTNLWNILKKMMRVNIKEWACIEKILKDAEMLNEYCEQIE